jgi:hypothetical protein
MRSLHDLHRDRARHEGADELAIAIAVLAQDLEGVVVAAV